MIDKLDSKIEKYLEQFNKEYPNGDSFELAKFMYEKGFSGGFATAFPKAYTNGYEEGFNLNIKKIFSDLA